MQTEVTLPPLPERKYERFGDPLFTADQMHAYLLAERERCARLLESRGDPELAEIVQAIREGVEAE